MGVGTRGSARMSQVSGGILGTGGLLLVEWSALMLIMVANHVGIFVGIAGHCT